MKIKLLAALFAISLIVVIAVVGILANNARNESDQPDSYPRLSGIVSESGEFVCLPHRDTSGPVTLECAFGFKTDTGRYYALDLNNIDMGSIALINMGDRIRVTGQATPIEMLSTDQWQKYNVDGIITVETMTLD